MNYFYSYYSKTKTMKTICFSFLLIISSFLHLSSQECCKFIIVDQFGYLPEAKKIAVIKNPINGFDSNETFTPGKNYSVVNKSNSEKIFSGSPIKWNSGNTHAGSGDRVWHFEFSEVKEPGTYYILDEEKGERSFDFVIAPNVYNEVLKHAMRSFFYQRAGFKKEAIYAGDKWADDASHIGPGQDKEARNYLDKNNPATERDVSGGWYDAGDYNKYTNWTANYVVELLKAYDERPGAWGDDYNIPESGNGIPDILDETKWGMDHLMRMQEPSGAVLSIVGLAHGSPPSSATGPSYWGPPNTSATLNTAAAFAYGSKIYRSMGLDEYADTLLARGVKAWEWAELYPDSLFNNNDPAFGSSGLGAGKQEVDNYGRLMIKLEAANYLYEVTGDVKYRDFFDSNYRESHLFQWSFAYPYEGRNQEILLYYTTLENGTPAVKDAIKNTYRNAILNGDNNLPAIKDERDPYHAFLDSYVWGSNGIKSIKGSMFYDLITYGFDNIDSIENSDAAMTYLNYIHGVNPLNFVYLSNMYDYGGDQGVNELYHSWFTDGSQLWDRVGESTYGPAPGYLTGGPNPSYDWADCCPGGCGSSSNNAKCTSESISPPKDQPDQKSYKDFNTSWPLNSWEITENSCGYQVNYIRLLSKFVNLDVDCNGDSGGTAFIDSCGICAGGNTGISPTLDKGECGFPVDCNGDVNGSAFIDSCGNCAGGNTGIVAVTDPSECKGPEYTIGFIFMDELTGEKLWSVNASLNEKTEISNMEGEVSFRLEEGEYTFFFEKLDYSTESGSININSDTTISFFLSRTHADIKFKLYQGSTPLNNVKVKLGNDSLLTNSLGIASFKQLPVSRSYSYMIKKEGYFDITGQISLITDTTIEVGMQETSTGIRNHSPDQNLEFWPNPVKDILHIKLQLLSPRSTVTIINLKGQPVLKKEINNKKNDLDISQLEKGMYFLHYSGYEFYEVYLIEKH